MKLLLALLLALILITHPPAQSQQQDTRTYVVNPVGMLPSPLHLTIQDMVEDCVGKPMIEPIRWAVADTIAVAPSGTLAYGLYIRRNDGTNIIFIERPFWFNATVISHELTHAIARAAESSIDISLCVIHQNPPLRLRIAADGYVDSLEGRDDVLRITHSAR